MRKIFGESSILVRSLNSLSLFPSLSFLAFVKEDFVRQREST